MPTYFIHLITSFEIVSTLFRIISTLFCELSTYFRVILMGDLIISSYDWVFAAMLLPRSALMLRSVAACLSRGIVFPTASVGGFFGHSRRSRRGSPFGVVIAVYFFVMRCKPFAQKSYLGHFALYVKMNLIILTIDLNNSISEIVLLRNLAHIFLKIPRCAALMKKKTLFNITNLIYERSFTMIIKELIDLGKATTRSLKELNIQTNPTAMKLNLFGASCRLCASFKIMF